MSRRAAFAVFLSLSVRTLAFPVAPGTAAPSETCGGCHVDIYRMWKGSAHSRSLEDMAFLGALRETEARDGAAGARVCLECHAPLAGLTGDLALRNKTSWEGVSCEVCHGIRSVELTPAGPRARVEIGPVKLGPIRDAVSTGHEVAYSQLHTDVLICAACHEYVNPEGVALMSTYSEWKESPAGKAGRTCQTCHMAVTEADVVDPKIKRVADAVNTHEIPGGHSLDQLYKALSVGIAPRREKGGVVVDVTLTNKGAGHAVPTGMPGRRVILEAWADAGQADAPRAQRVYAREFRGPDGKVIEGGSGYFTKGVRPGEDTRLKAGERRKEVFHFAVPEGSAATVHVKLSYEHFPREGPEDRTSLTFVHEIRTVPPAGS